MVTFNGETKPVHLGKITALTKEYPISFEWNHSFGSQLIVQISAKFAIFSKGADSLKIVAKEDMPVNLDYVRRSSLYTQNLTQWSVFLCGSSLM